jgi:hypothetical protein
VLLLCCAAAERRPFALLCTVQSQPRHLLLHCEAHRKYTLAFLGTSLATTLDPEIGPDVSTPVSAWVVVTVVTLSVVQTIRREFMRLPGTQLQPCYAQICSFQLPTGQCACTLLLQLRHRRTVRRSA